MATNKPYKVTFVLDNWELLKDGQRIKIRGNRIGDPHTAFTTPPLIRYDEEERWAETQTCIYKLLSRRKDDRLESSEAEQQQERADKPYQDAPCSPSVVRKA